MGNKLNRLHLFLCIFTWITWAIGIGLLLISSTVFNNDNATLFNIVHAYNSVVLVLSLVPVEAIVFILSLKNEIRNKFFSKTAVITILLFVITLVLWITYISVFVTLTGGV